MMRLSRRATVVPAPFVAPTTQVFDGNDGQWSTFLVSIGSPGQSFRVLPSTAGTETWVPLPQGCQGSGRSNCSEERGVDSFNGRASDGFNTDASDGWNDIGLYSLDLESDLGYTGNGSYGTDSVTLGSPTGSDTLSSNNSVVAGIADTDYFLGLFGLSARPSSFSNNANNSQSFLAQAASNNQIPSLSYGYTAGAVYQNRQVEGSLILGGYDESRFQASNKSIQFASSDATALEVGVQSIVADNTLSGTVSFTAQNTDNSNGGGFFAVIDSTVPEIWMPRSVCDAFADALGLIYDNNTDLYVVNDTIHSQLQDNNPTFTFKLGDKAFFNANGTNIILPYAAFDLQASWPIYNNPTNYFPIRRAANESQQTIGRALLQEAYLIVDYERRNFSINQATFSDPMPSSQIVTIHSLKSSNGGSSGSSLSGGAIAGIVIGAIAGVVLIALAAWLLFRRRRKHALNEKAAELDNNEVHHMADEKRVDDPGTGTGMTVLSEAGGNQVHEMASPAPGEGVGERKFDPDVLPNGPANGVPPHGIPNGDPNADSTYGSVSAGGFSGNPSWNGRQELESPARYEMDAGEDHHVAQKVAPTS